jgi:hypothetical protein
VRTDLIKKSAALTHRVTADGSLKMSSVIGHKLPSHFREKRQDGIRTRSFARELPMLRLFRVSECLGDRRKNVDRERKYDSRVLLGSDFHERLQVSELDRHRLALNPFGCHG